jgi:hypothetical protein
MVLQIQYKLLYVSNFTQPTTTEELKCLFCAFGPLKRCIVYEHYAVVHFEEKTDDSVQ